MKTADELIMDKYVDQPKWINVNDRMPIRNQGVLVHLTNGLITCAYRCVIKGIRSWQLYGPVQDICDLKQEQVTHWQPLPKSPTI
jgi:hypothetical protein